MNLKHQMEHEKGFSKGQVDPLSLYELRSIVGEFLARRTGLIDCYRDITCNRLDSGELSKITTMTMIERTLDSDHAQLVMCQPWFRSLMENMSMLPLDAYNLDIPCFTVRVTRPGHPEDVGPLHKDVWFWNIAGRPSIIDSKLPPTLQTVKVWVGLEVERELSGLLVVPHSQKDLHYPSYDVIEKKGYKKPVINKRYSESIQPIHTASKSGDFVVFGEQLVHGGAINRGSKPRVSLEVACASPSQCYYKTYGL